MVLKLNIGIMYTTLNFNGDTLLQEKVEDMAHHKLGIKEDGAFHSRAYKSGFWDGITDFYDRKEQKFHSGLLPQFLEGIRELQEADPSITYELVDQRPEPLLPVDAMDEEIVLEGKDGDPIILRPYQYESVQRILEEQTGVVNISTNGGKTLTAAGIIQQLRPHLKRKERIAFFTHSKEIFAQAAKSIGSSLGIKEKDIGFIGDGKMDFKHKQLVFVMVPTLVSALKDPKKDIKFTHKDRVIKFIAEEVAPKFSRTQNTRQLLRNYIKNCNLTTKVWLDVEEHLNYIAYDQSFTDKKAQMQLNKYIVELDKIIEKKNKKKFDKYKQTMEFIDSIRVMIADEVHHSKAITWFTSLSLCENATYRVGLTGTVDKKDKMGWQRMQALFNQIVIKVSNDFLIKEGVSSKPTIRVVPIKEPRNIELAGNYLEAYKAGIVENEYRNEVAAKLVKWYADSKPGGILISVKEIAHGEAIVALLKDKNMDVDFIHGGSDAEHRSSTLERFAEGKLHIMVASTIIDEGVDLRSIGCMVLLAGGRSMRQQLQRIGRGLRLNGIDGNSVLVFDFLDQTHSILLTHSKERMRIFKEEKFNVQILGE